ncbi:MAG: hypothetical protein I8H77_09645 [Comamonadaceae bacterium]|nr:hypothetical protein [Comamonadaceae bacterium]
MKNINLNFAQRGLFAEKQMGLAAADYKRTTAGIAVEIIAGILTGGIGFIAIEAYHAYNRSQKTKEFSELADALLQGMRSMPHDESGFITEYQGTTLAFTRSGDDLEISLGSDVKIIPGKTMRAVRENLKAEILSNPHLYTASTVKNALWDETHGQRALAIDYLRRQTDLHSFDHLSKQKIVASSIILTEDPSMLQVVKDSLTPNEQAINRVVDHETLELIKAWNSKSSTDAATVEYEPAVEAISANEVNSTQLKDEKRVRGLMAEILFPENSWEADTKEDGARLKSALVSNSALLAEIYANPDLLDSAELPSELGGMIKELLHDFSRHTNLLPNSVNKDNLAKALSAIPDTRYSEISADIDNNISSFEFKSLDSVKMLSTISTMGEGNFQTFMARIFENYFDAQPVMDKRAMLASYLTNSKSSDEGEVKLVALLKAGGPYIQKLLQLFGDKAQGSLKDALDALKTDLSPIKPTIIESVLAGIVAKSNGTITKIEVEKSLGAASVGQTVLAKMHGEDPNKPQEVVIKILRPGIRLRAERELQFFTDVATDIPGMLKTFDGISTQIQVEMDLSKEGNFVELAQVYSRVSSNLQAMKLAGQVAPARGYLVLEKAPGTTVKTSFDELESQLVDENRDKLAISHKSAKLASGIQALTKTWIEEAFFGSGFYHGDLHAGNIMFSAETGANGMTTVIDMGNAYILSIDQRSAIFKMVLAVGLSKPEVFAKSFEKILSDDGKKLISDKREEFFAKIKDAMRAEEDRGQVIVSILNSANQLGMEIPAAISNFSRSQIMLQNAITKINHIGSTNLKDQDDQLNELLSNHIDGENDLKGAREQAARKLEKLRNISTQAAPSFLENELTQLISLIDQRQLYKKISFAKIIDEVLSGNKLQTALLAAGDYWNILTDRV